jgi:hypothetical protein
MRCQGLPIITGRGRTTNLELRKYMTFFLRAIAIDISADAKNVETLRYSSVASGNQPADHLGFVAEYLNPQPWRSLPKDLTPFTVVVLSHSLMAFAFFGLGFTSSQDSTCPIKSISNRANSVFAWFV